MDDVSYVIPIYNKWHLTNQVLEDIHKNCSDVLEVIVVNDNSPEQEVYDGLELWGLSKRLPITVIENKENLMFLLSTNIGLRAARGEYVITISNDVRVRTDLSKFIKNILKNSPKSFVGGKLLSNATGWNNFGDRVFPYIEGWLMATTNEGWKELGYLDERYAPSDMEDVDISTTALKLGYKLVPLNHPAIKHIGAQSIGYNPKREATTKRNREYFRRKWLGE